MIIEKNIPLPKKAAGTPRKSPIWSMEIGDSYLTDNRHRGEYCYVANANGWKFTTRKEGDGFRVWRVA
jgi:hypothetical protein